MPVELFHGDSREVLRGLPDCSVDSVVCDPPYELGFMGKAWDASGVAYDVGLWGEVLRVLKPGGHLLAFGGSRTYHRLACAVEDAGFEIRDQLMWIYGSGFPKSLDVSKAIDKQAGAERERVPFSGGIAPGSHNYGGNGRGVGAGGTKQGDVPITSDAERWQGWGTALKPAHEPVVLGRRRLVGTVAENVLGFGVGGLNIDECRVEGDVPQVTQGVSGTEGTWRGSWTAPRISQPHSAGRWPANVLHDGSDEVVGLFAGGAARFFYCAKASRAERNAGLDGMPEREAGIKNESGRGFSETDPHRKIMRQNHHPTVKPLALMRYLTRLVTPPGGTVLDPFAGSGTTLMAATLEGFNAIGIEMTDEYLPIIRGRVAWAEANRGML